MTQDHEGENGTMDSQKCKLSAGAEPGTKRKWHKVEHSGTIRNGFQMMLALSFPALVRAMPP
eukprot:9989597-Karenia_brevis.AAC.1